MRYSIARCIFFLLYHNMPCGVQQMHKNTHYPRFIYKANSDTFLSHYEVIGACRIMLSEVDISGHGLMTNSHYST